MNTRRLLIATALATLGPAALPALGQPLEGTLRLMVPYAPGGSSDRAARLVADKLAPQLGVNVIVENKPGAGGRLAAQALKNMRADQNVLLLANPAIMVVAPLVYKDVGYDPEKDFQPVSTVTQYEFGVAVSEAVPVRELSHLFAWLRANPEKANFGVPATGSLPHFFGLMVSEQAKVKGEIVGYKGSAPLINDLLGGQIPVAFDTLDSLVPQQGAKLRILATSGSKRSQFSPDIPTFTEAGLPLAADGWNTFFAPAAMPAARVAMLSKAIAGVMKDPATQALFTASKMEPVSSTAEQTRTMLKIYRAQWAPVVQKSGYQP